MENCIFCKIVNGEIPSSKVYEDDATLAFVDINPSSPGHCLVIPKMHAKNIFEITPESWSQVQETVRRVSVAAEKAMEAAGVNLNMNNREHAGQVIDHAHVHIIPRYVNDGLKLWPHHPLKEGEGTAIAEKIKNELQ